jgi:hypothetical protein
LLIDDAWLAMPPAPHEYHGTDAIAGFFRASAAGPGGHRFGLVRTQANGQPAFLCFLGDPEDPGGQALGCGRPRCRLGPDRRGHPVPRAGACGDVPSQTGPSTAGNS